MISREAVIRQIVEREMQGLSLMEEAAVQDSPDLHQAACERFGTWDTALQYAGVSLRRLHAKPDYTPERVLRKIRTLCRHGYSLKARDNMYRDRPLYEAARRHFGGWRRALQEAGIELKRANLRSKPRQLDRQKIIQSLQERHRAGQSLRWASVCMEDRALASAAKQAFNGWGRALVAAGILSESQCIVRPQKWDKQRVIQCIQIRQQEGKPLHNSGVQRDDARLVLAARRYFGSWNDALTAAGVGPQRRKPGRARQ
jgi:hypothetical protein